MAEEKLSTSIDVDKLESDFEADPGNFVPLARAYIERKLAEQAVAVCQKGLRKNPAAKDGRLALAMAYYHAYDDRKAEKVAREVVQTQPESAAAAHRVLGEILLERNQEQEAIQELSRAHELDPKDPYTRELLKALGMPSKSAGNGVPEGYWMPRAAVIPRELRQPMWKTIVQTLVLAALVAAGLVYYDHHVKVKVQVREHFKKAGTLLPRDNYADLLGAEKELDQALQLKPSDEKLVTRQAFVQSLLWLDHAQADRKEKLKSALAWMEEEDLPNPERFALKGLMLADEGKAQDADKYLEEVISRAIEKKDIFLNGFVFGARAHARLRMGRTEDAREDFNRAARFSGDSPHFQALYADVYVREGNWFRAVKGFQDALRTNPAHHFSNLRLAYALLQTGKNLETARKILDEYSNPEKVPEGSLSPPLTGMLYLARAEYALRQGDLAQASDLAAKSIKAYDASAEAHDLAGRLATINKDGAKAGSEFAKALALDPYLPKIYFDRAESMFELGQKEDALNKLKEFTRHLKPTVAYHVRTGNLLMRMERLDLALAEFQQAVKVDELNPEARFHVGLAYQKMGEGLGTSKEKQEEKRNLYNKAREEYENTLILPGGEKAEVYCQMGQIYLDSEDFDNAMDKLAKCALMMQQAGEPSSRIAEVYFLVAKVFKEMGGSEGEKNAKMYTAKAEALRQGKTMDQVEREFKEAEEKEQKNRRGRRGR